MYLKVNPDGSIVQTEKMDPSHIVARTTHLNGKTFHEFGRLNKGRWFPVPLEKAAQPKPVEIGEGPGTVLKDFLASLNMPVCQQCIALAKRMNDWGVAGCRENLYAITEDILPRFRVWWNGSSAWMKAELWPQSKSSSWTGLKAFAGSVLNRDIDNHLREIIRDTVEWSLAEYEQKKEAGESAA